MLNFYVKARTWMEQDEGATAVEYGIMVAAIAAVIVGVVVALGLFLDVKFGEVLTAIGGTVPE
jgi:pilus assembly protein Flp/PilA